MLDSIEEVHDRGFIHRDVKAVTFLNLFKFSRILCYLQTTNTFILLTLGWLRST